MSDECDFGLYDDSTSLQHWIRIVGGCAVIAVTVGIWWWWRQSPSGPSTSPSPPPPPPESSVAALFNGAGVYVAMLPAAKGGITADALYKTDRISGPAAGQAYPRCMSLALLTKRLPVNLPPSASGPPPLGVLLRKDLLSPYVQCLAVSLNPPVTQRTCPYFSAAKHKCQCQGGSDLDCARQSPAQQAGCGVPCSRRDWKCGSMHWCPDSMSAEAFAQTYQADAGARQCVFPPARAADFEEAAVAWQKAAVSLEKGASRHTAVQAVLPQHAQPLLTQAIVGFVIVGPAASELADMKRAVREFNELEGKSVQLFRLRTAEATAAWAKNAFVSSWDAAADAVPL